MIKYDKHIATDGGNKFGQFREFDESDLFEFQL